MSISNIIQSYLKLLERLSRDQKLDIISYLSQSIKDKVKPKRGVAYFRGAWQSEESAEDILKDIHRSRRPGRQLEDL